MRKIGLTAVDFRKVFIVYVVIAIIAGIASTVVLGVVFSEKISFVLSYHHVIETYDKNEETNSFDALREFADTSPDIADILVLDRDNRVLFSAHNTIAAKDTVFHLEAAYDRPSDGEGRNRYLTHSAQPGVYYRVAENKFPDPLKGWIGDWIAPDDFEERHFYESGEKHVYSISYIINRQSGQKIYFVFDIAPVANGAVYLKIIAAAAMLFFMIYWILLALYVYADASKSRLSGAAWGFLTLFTNLAGLLLYLIYKQSNQTCFKCLAVQSKTNTFCMNCGTKLADTCKKCEGTVPRGQPYCAHCGAKND